MTEWKARRFWEQAEPRAVDGGFEVALDGRSLRTPGKHALILPTRALAQAVADEWNAQGELIQPQTMPLTRAVNSAVEKVAPQFDGVVDMLAEYGATDLLCYRATDPEDLIRAQAAAWDPLMDWAATELRAPLRMTHGVIPVDQDAGSLARLRAEIAGLDIWGVTALHDLVTLPGSLIIGLAVIRGRITPDQAHDLSRVDENFQISRWGADDDATEAAETRRQAILTAGRLWHLLRNDLA
ncbi:ATP12 family chaperone protein [Paracoccus sp. (in: a-proteobacteria)]|uniref:ATP12 family chaperone protein n=1 Tax=Paracoccus sp. TaxID=267 RepID=UPI0026E0E393|nr:ATP12 family protein [Paracoccus sp. (in: a-proteobacteria)]MDO5648094.1 ATP12 family protein [Paracoccus sp. (in: a-proteobacteria)]